MNAFYHSCVNNFVSFALAIEVSNIIDNVMNTKLHSSLVYSAMFSFRMKVMRLLTDSRSYNRETRSTSVLFHFGA
jgi:hypothetical protein